MDFSLTEIDTITKAEEGAWMPLKKLDGEPLLNKKGDPVELCLHGSDSREYRTAVSKNTRAQMKRARDKKLTDQDHLDAATADDIALLASCTCGWRGMLDTHGVELQFNKSGAGQLYTAYPVARDQADRFIGDRANFTQASSAT